MVMQFFKQKKLPQNEVMTLAGSDGETCTICSEIPSLGMRMLLGPINLRSSELRLWLGATSTGCNWKLKLGRGGWDLVVQNTCLLERLQAMPYNGLFFFQQMRNHGHENTFTWNRRRCQAKLPETRNSLKKTNNWWNPNMIFMIYVRVQHVKCKIIHPFRFANPSM